MSVNRCRIVINVVEIQLVHQRIGGLISRGRGNVFATVYCKAECLSEVGVGKNNAVLVALGRVHGLEHSFVGIEEEAHRIGFVYSVQLIAEVVVGKLFRRRRPLAEFALEERLLSSSVVHDVDDDLVGLPLLNALTVDFEVGVRNELAFIVLGKSVPIFVLGKYHLLFFLEGLELVNAVRHRGFFARTVSGGYERAAGVFVSFVERLINKPCGSKRGKEVVEIEIGCRNVTDGVIINLVATYGVILYFIGEVAGIVEKEFFE